MGMITFYGKDDEYCCEYDLIDEAIFNPTWYFGEEDDARWEIGNPESYEVDYESEIIAGTNGDTGILNAHKKKILSHPYEVKYFEIMKYLYMFNFYYVSMQNENNWKPVKIRSASYIKDYCISTGCTNYWESMFLDNKFPDIPRELVIHFRVLLKTKEVWDGTGLWDFIVKYEFRISDNNGKKNFEKYMDKMKKFDAPHERRTEVTRRVSKPEKTRCEIRTTPHKKRTENWD